MKKLVFVFTAAALLAGSALAALDLYDTVTAKTISTLKSSFGTETNSVVDVAQAKGVCNLFVTMSAGVASNATFGASATLTTCATTNGTFVNVTNGAGSVVRATCYSVSGTGTVTSIKVEAQKLSRYVKLVTVSTNDVSHIGAVLLYSN